MGRSRRRIQAVAALAAGALPIALGVGTASADEFFNQFASSDHTFTAGDGSTVTCTVSGESSLSRPNGQNAYDAEALTSAAGDSPSCSITFVEVEVSYRDPAGRERHTGADSIDGDVRWFVKNDVSSGFSVVHRVTFDDCRADCEVTFTTSPK
jgi:hypothetical protein